VTVHIPLADAAEAAKFITLGMRPRLLPSRDLVYLDYVRRYKEDETFAELTEAVANGLGLAVLGCSQQTGLVLAATSGSLFEMKMDEYSRRAALRHSPEKTLHGLIHLAVAAVAYPRPADLADDFYIGRVSVEQVDAVVREACRMLDEKATATEESLDPLEDAPALEKTWRVYARRPSAAATKDGRLLPDTTRSMISKALKFLAEQGFLSHVNGEGGGTYRTTPRYQVQVRELAADSAFAELLELGVVTVGDGRGTLHTVDESDIL
jgi:hypothetical protein